MSRSALIIGVVFFALVLSPFDFAQGKPYSAEAALIDQVNQAYRAVYGVSPTVSEWTYWAGRVQRGEKKTYAALVGAIGYQRAQGSSPTASTIERLTSTAAAASGFATDKKFYPSSHNPNFLPEGTLVSSPSTPNIYYVRDGKKSWVLPSILNTWFRENHFFKQGNLVLTISDSDLARYPTASSVNKLYIGKVLKHPTGSQFYIDDKLRKRPLSASVRSALKFPAGNLYSASAVHLREFRTGPALKSDAYPGGMAVYDGPYHGGRIWKTEEIAGGAIVKRLYLKDRFYEADYPDESQRAPASAAMLAQHPRGKNIDRYPDGWVIGIGNNIYVMQNGARRLIASAGVLNALGYRDGTHIRREYPDIFGKYAQGQPIRAFKGVTADGASPSKGAPAAAPNSATNLTKVRPGIRTLIGQVNDHFRFVFDKDPSISENKSWVDYLYNGEVTTKEDLLAAMRRAKSAGRTTLGITSRTARINEDTLKSKWFPYLFYFVHQKEPNEDDKSYWYSRIDSDRKTIEGLGGTIQWVKENFGGATRR